MNTITSTTLLLMLAKVTMLQCAYLGQLVEPKLVCEPEPTTEMRLAELGGESASNLMQKRLQDVLYNYQQKGLLTQEALKEFTLHYFKDGYLKAQNAIESMQAQVIDTNTAVWVTKDHDIFPDHESKSQLAHEVAHYIFNTKCKVGPAHLWRRFLDYTPAVTASGLAVAFYIAQRAAAKTAKAPDLAIRKAPPRIAAGLALASLAHFYVGTLMGWNNYVPPIVKKSEEVACDLLAARVLPNGFAAGYDFYSRASRIHPNSTSSDHPTLNTRIRYHLLGKLSDEYFRKQENKSIQ